jgi:hypothetical protein
LADKTNEDNGGVELHAGSDRGSRCSLPASERARSAHIGSIGAYAGAIDSVREGRRSKRCETGHDHALAT